MKRKLLITLALVSVFVLGGFTYQASKPQWEYKIVNLKFNSGTEQKLNEIGGQGWELVSAERNIANGETLDAATYHFKRAK